MKNKFKHIIACASAVILPTAALAPTLTLTSCGFFPNIIDSSTVKSLKITSQQDTTATFEFKTNRNLDSNYLTALVQVDNSADTKFTISPKAYVNIQNKKITVTVTYDATDVDEYNDTVKFHITFTNSDPKNTWAETITDLSITYASPFFDYAFEYTGYLFAGQDAQKSNYRAWKIALDQSVDLDSVKIEDLKCTTGNITLDIEHADIHINTTHSVYVYVPYTSFSAAVGDTIGISLTLSCTVGNSTCKQTYIMGLTAVNQLYLLDSKATINTGADYAWYYFYMGLPLGDAETEDDITVTITQSQTSDQPMYIDPDNIIKQLDWENNYFSIVLTVKEGYVDPVKMPKVKFDVKIEKPDTRATLLTGGSAAWDQTFKDVELSFDGDHLELVDQSTIKATPSKGATMSFNQTFKNIGEYMSIEKFNWTLEFILDETTLPSGFNPTEKEWSYFAGDFTFGKMSEEVLFMQCKMKNDWPNEWKSYISSHDSITCSWKARFTSKKEISSTEPVKKYQKQVFEISDWIETTFTNS